MSFEMTHSNSAALPSGLETVLNGLRGGITIPEAELLHQLARDVTSGCIVEVGSFRGKSAVTLAAGVRANPAGQRPPIYCIEPHRPFVGYYGGKFGPQDRGAFYDVMVRTEAYQDVALINLSSEEVAPSWKEPVSLLFIDGDHRYHGVKRDFDCWDEHVLPGGIVAFDDAADPDCGPHQLIQEILASGRYLQHDGCGKIVVLKKIDRTPEWKNSRPRRILVACETIILSGGLLRFDRVGHVLRGWGHDVTFLTLGDRGQSTRTTELPVISLQEAMDRTWDAVMIPGAGFPAEIIEQFALLRDSSFGIRVQHVLNDQTRRTQFLHVNRIFEPQIVVFNTDWPVGSYHDFQGDRFHHLYGAVNLQEFRPRPYRSHPLAADQWIIGGQASKNPEPLIEALKNLPAFVKVRLFGGDVHGLAQANPQLIASGRLELTGPLERDALCKFYRDVDCVVMTETYAGWSNIVAEAMASGVPVVCTPHGTHELAKHEESAIVVRTPTAASLAEGVRRLLEDPQLCERLTESAAANIARFSWENYSQELLKLIFANGRSKHYLHLPEHRLYGKWSLEERVAGLHPLLEKARGKTVIDLGAAEGGVAREFLKLGAIRLHGFELDVDRVRAAQQLCAQWSDATFRRANLADWPTFTTEHRDLLDQQYDIVLYLGLHHHLPTSNRMSVLDGALGLARSYFAIRSPEAAYQSDRIHEHVLRRGFELVHSGEHGQGFSGYGRLSIYLKAG